MRGGGGAHNLSSPVKSQHCCSEIDVTLMPFSAVICLLALILMHVDAGLKSPATDRGSERAGRKKTARNNGWRDGREEKRRR